MRQLVFLVPSLEVFVALGALAALSACSGGESSPSADGGKFSSGGNATGGGATGGVSSASGGASGGVSTTTGGATTGGATTGGATTGGAMTGGATTGGATTGGATTGGATTATGGASGAATGGAAGAPVNSGGSTSAGAGGSSKGGAGAGGAGAGGWAQGGGGQAGAPASGGSAQGGSAGKGSGGAGGASACPLDLIGFATLEGSTTGGGAAPPTTVTTQAELRACATATEPRVCRVQGTLTFSPFEEIRVKSNKTIIGAGANASIVMGGFMLEAGVRNVIIRNLTIRDSVIEGANDDGGDRDGVQMDTADHVWIDHVRFRHLGDGLIDSRKDTTFLTVSWNILEDHDKAFGIGWTENVTAQMTIHHNWLRNTNQRNPSTDNVLRAHLFNNLMENLTSYGNYARGGTNMVLQNSVFVNVKDPHYYDTGTLVATGNIYRTTTGMRTSTGATFSFFDPSAFYSYRLDPADQVEALVKRCAGPRAELGGL